MNPLYYFYHLSISIVLFRCIDVLDNKIENEKNCRERNRLITSAEGDIFMLVDAIPGEKITLQCHYCGENDDQQPKIWYKMKAQRDSKPEEVNLGMDSNVTHNRIRVTIEHSLIIRNVTINDTGFYYCIGLEGQESANKYSYLIDVVFDNGTNPETGSMTKWRQYHEEYLEPVNQMFKKSQSEEVVYVREKLFLSIEVVTEWDHWGPCEVCGRPAGEGRRHKKGFCRIKLTQTTANKPITARSDEESILLGVYELSCRSLILERVFPSISQDLKYLPHFVQTEPCDGLCNPDAEGLSKGWKSGKRGGFKYRKSYVLAQSDHLVLICPESTLLSTVIWHRNGQVLKPGQIVQSGSDEEPRIIVDTFNTLYLHDVTSEEDGNYTCQVDNVNMQQIDIFVVSKSRILTQAFVRHMLYLSFVLSLTFSCYCAGLFITWKKRSSFKTYEDLLMEKGEKMYVANSDYSEIYSDED